MDYDFNNKTTLGKIKLLMLKGEQGKTGKGTLVANSVADMVDKSQIYVYTGTTTEDYTFGHWCYWDGTEWVDGGDYKVTIAETDKTLTEENVPADGAATGAAINTETLNFKLAVGAFLNSKIGENSFDDVQLTWESGGLTSQGVEQANSARIRTGFIDVFAFSSYTRVLSGGYQVYAVYYNKNKQRISSTSDWSAAETATITIQNTKYIRFVLRKNISPYTATIDPSEGSNLSVSGSWKYPDETIVTPYLSGKTGIVMGDSISYGLYSYWTQDNKRMNSDGLTPDYAIPRISDYFAQLAGMSIYNYAARGTGYVADTRNLGNALVRANNVDFGDYDFAALCFGINDWIRGMTMGNLTDKAEGTVIGNLCAVLQKIYSDNALCKVVIYTPYNAWGQVADDLTTKHYYGDEESNYALGTNNSQSYTLQDLIDAIKNTADYYGVTCTGLGDSNIVNRLNIKDIMIDGLHPSLESLPLLAAEMFAQKDFG